MTQTPDSVQQDLNSDDFGDRLRGINHLRQLDPTVAFGMILPILNDSNVRVRYAAVSQMDVLGKVDPQRSLGFLRDRLKQDPEADVRAAAADAIGALKLTEAYEDLKQAYEGTSDWLIQMSVIACLGELGDPRSFDLLKSALDSPEPLVQLAAVSSLGELGNPEAVELLLPLLDHEDWQVRQRLVQAMARLNTAEAHLALKRLAQDEMEPVASYAQDCLNAEGV